eukprot:gene11422-biopygen3167
MCTTIQTDVATGVRMHITLLRMFSELLSLELPEQSVFPTLRPISNSMANITINSMANITINSMANITINGIANITINSMVNITINGMVNITINGMANITIN